MRDYKFTTKDSEEYPIFKKNNLRKIIIASALAFGILIAEPFVFEGISNSRPSPEEYILIENPRGVYNPIG